MKTIRLKTDTINDAANEAGMSTEKFVSMIRSVSCGRKVCAHFIKFEGAYSIFVCR